MTWINQSPIKNDFQSFNRSNVQLCSLDETQLSMTSSSLTKSGGFFPHSLLKSCPMTKLKLSLHVTNRMWLADSVIRNGTITPLWQSLRNYFVFDQVLNPLWYILFAIGQIFTVVNGQMLNNDLAVGSQTHTVDKCQMTSTAATEWRPHIQEIIAPNFIL